MKKVNLVLAQTNEELKFIINNINEEAVCIPLNLETYIYCKINKINFFDPINFLDNNFHKEALLESDHLVNRLKYGNLNSDSLRKRYKGIIRSFFHSCFYISEIVNSVKKKYLVENIYLSGWNEVNFLIPKKNLSVSQICKQLLINEKIKFVGQKNTTDQTFENEMEYSSNFKKKITKKSILVTNLGYNFKRLIFWTIKNQYKIIYLSFENVNLLKKIIFSLLGVKFVFFDKKPIKNLNSVKIDEINFTTNKNDFSNILNIRRKQSINFLFDLKQRCKIANDFITKHNPGMILLNYVRGLDGYCAEVAKKNQIPSICISHGTIAKSYNEFDDLYKKIIAENVFSGDSKFFAIQTRITDEALQTHKISGKPIRTGNIIFAEAKRKYKKKYISYAVTMKDFVNFQFYGVEMYYEFFNNLKIFQSISEKEKFDFLIKPHPSIKNCIKDLEKLFPNLEFTNDKIEKVLEKSFVTISYSSSTIDDSICSKVPVILFDPWSRYKHCSSQEDPKINNCAVYYMKNKDNLISAIKTIILSDNINFNDFIFNGKATQNIKKMFFDQLS